MVDNVKTADEPDENTLGQPSDYVLARDELARTA